MITWSDAFVLVGCAWAMVALILVLRLDEITITRRKKRTNDNGE